MVAFTTNELADFEGAEEVVKVDFSVEEVDFNLAGTDFALVDVALVLIPSFCLKSRSSLIFLVILSAGELPGPWRQICQTRVAMSRYLLSPTLKMCGAETVMEPSVGGGCASPWALLVANNF